MGSPSGTPVWTFVPPDVALSHFFQYSMHGMVKKLRVADEPDTFGVDVFCLRGQLCTQECPPEAIFDTKQQETTLAPTLFLAGDRGKEVPCQ